MPSSSQPLSQEDFHFVREHFQRETSILLEDDKEYLIQTRLTELARQEGMGADPSRLVTAVRARPHGPLGRRLVEALTTNETYWFRDSAVFKALKEVVLPTLIAARAPQRRLRIWIGAASTGQEPYSLAITLREHFPELASWDVRILATDIDESVLARARSGEYELMEIQRGMPAKLLAKHFERAGTKFRVRQDVRKMVEFRRLNLDGQLGLVAQDLVLLCNVLIYFQVDVRKRILQSVASSLAPDGYLFFATSEVAHPTQGFLVRETLHSSSCYRLAGRAVEEPRAALPRRPPSGASTSLDAARSQARDQHGGGR